MVVVIKPDAISHRDEIIKKFEDEGLVIIKSKKINLGDKFLTEKMYGNLPDDIKEETLNHFRRGQAEVILLGLWNEKQEDILKKVISLTGEETDPHECDMKSIRNMFGDHEGILTKEGKNILRMLFIEQKLLPRERKISICFYLFLRTMRVN